MALLRPHPTRGELLVGNLENNRIVAVLPDSTAPLGYVLSSSELAQEDSVTTVCQIRDCFAALGTAGYNGKRGEVFFDLRWRLKSGLLWCVYEGRNQQSIPFPAREPTDYTDWSLCCFALDGMKQCSEKNLCCEEKTWPESELVPPETFQPDGHDSVVHGRLGNPNVVMNGDGGSKFSQWHQKAYNLALQSSRATAIGEIRQAYRSQISFDVLPRSRNECEWWIILRNVSGIVDDQSADIGRGGNRLIRVKHKVAFVKDQRTGLNQWIGTWNLLDTWAIDRVEQFHAVAEHQNRYIVTETGSVKKFNTGDSAQRRQIIDVPLRGGELVQVIIRDSGATDRAFAVTSSYWFELREPFQYHDFDLGSPNSKNPMQTLVRCAHALRARP